MANLPTASVVSLTGNDTIIINGINFTDLADGNVAELTFPNELAAVKTGKNGNTIYGLNAMGVQCELKLRLIRASSDDQTLQALMNLQNQDFSSFPLMIGTLTKNVGQTSFSPGVSATPVHDVYNLAGGIFTKQVEVKSNVEGDTEQSVSIYTMKFATVNRIIGG